jgi:subtilisin family serine protease
MPGDSKQSRFLLSLFVAAAATCTGGLTAAATPPGRVAIGPLHPGTPTHPQIDRSKVDVSVTLERQLQHGKADFAIEFSERADLSAAAGMGWNERGRYVYQRLRETAERSQAGARRALRARGVTFESFWIKNTILVRHGDLDTLAAASRLDGIERIRELPEVKFIEPKRVQEHARSAAEAIDAIGENIRHIGAPQAWAELSVSGNGVTVGIIDNGVHYTHAAIVKQYRGNHGGIFDHDYNWLNPYSYAAEPVTNGNPHGTHVTGTVVGDDHNADMARRNRIGVAPGAQWMSCLGIGTDGLVPDRMLDCGQFMLAPTRTDGTDGNPDLRPQVVNNSWSEGTCDGSTTPFYANVLESWIAAGIFPVFAAGNTFSCGGMPEPHLSTVSSPASLASAFAVGSTGNHDGEYATHSLWGPTTDSSPGLPRYPDPRGFPHLKPQVVAPGVDVRSATDNDDRGYITMTGTSMSSPHITGLVALMLEAGECLRGDYATLGTIIMQTAKPIPYDTGGDPAPGPGNVPNYATGWGEIDAAAAVRAAANACGPQGFLAGKVTAAGGAAVSGAKIEIYADSGAKIYQAMTDTDGSFKRRVPQLLNGGYTMKVSAFGYLPSSEAGVLVSNGEITRRDTQLATAPMHKVTGRITDAATGWPLHAKVSIGGYPNGPIWSDPVTGLYSARLPEGTPYRIDISSDVPGYLAASRDLPVLGDGAQDFALNADTTTCIAPGYRYAQTLLSEDFEQTTGTPPVGWSRSSAGLGWLFGTTAELSSSNFPIPEHGRFAAANDGLGTKDNDGRNDMLVMPTLNLAGLTRPVLRFSSYVFHQYPRATIEASTDGGATWTALGTPQTTAESGGRWLPTAMSLAPVAAGNVRLRFHSDDGTTDQHASVSYGWALDDVSIVANCSAPTQGGLVIGHVRDANSGTPLNGAVVGTNGTEVTTFGSADPGVGDGFFALYAASGSPLLQAKRGSQPAGYGEASATPSVSPGTTTRTELALPAGRLRLYPAGPTSSVVLGTTATVPFTVTNSGTQSVNFGFEQAAVEEHFDGSAFPPTGWSRQNDTGNCGWRALDPYYEANYAGGDGVAAVIQMSDCGIDATARVDSSLITLPLDLSGSHTASMGFFLSLLNGVDNLPRFDVDVSRDGDAWTTVSTRATAVDESGPGRLIELDLTSFVGSANVRVRFRYQGTPPNGYVMIDQVHLFNGVSMSPMLKLAPESGTLVAGESRTLDATFDARAIVQPGTYTMPVRVAEDTPYDWPFGDVEAAMTVTAPASYGSIGGVVQSLGYCDAHPSPLASVPVTIAPAGGQAYTTTTAEDGSYRYWVEAALGPFTVSVAAPDHVSASRSIAVTAGNTADGALGLRSLKPCLLSDPAAPSASLPAGQSLQQPFTLMNAGAAGADWTLRAGGDPNVSSLVQLMQTNSQTPAADSGIACIAAGTSFSFDNRYMRVFPLAERGLPDRSVLVTGVSFAIDTAVGVQGSQPIDVRVHALSGDLLSENLQLLREKTVTVADTSVQRMSVVFDQPLSVRGDTVLVAEIHVPGNGRDVSFTAGGNQLGETAPAYLMAPQCGIHEPTTYADIDPRAGKFNLILEIDTQAPDPCGPHATPVDWLGVSQPSGHIDADAGLPLKALFNVGGRTDGSYRGTMCITPGNTPAPIVVPVTMHVGAGGDAIFRNGFD